MFVSKLKIHLKKQKNIGVENFESFLLQVLVLYFLSTFLEYILRLLNTDYNFI